MKIIREEIAPDEGSSFKVLLTPGLNDTFLWHFHPEYEIVYVEGTSGTRHVGDHTSIYEGSDLVFIGPNIPHLNFDYGVRTECEQVIIQMKENFLGKDFLEIPEFAAIKRLFGQSHFGLSFAGSTKQIVGEKLKILPHLDHFDQLMSLLQILRILATSDQVSVLNNTPAGNKSLQKEQFRMDSIYKYVETHFDQKPDVNFIAEQVNLTTAAFCRFFKKNVKMTFTDFVNQYRINQAKNYLLQDKTVSETCFAVGFESLSYFNKLFKKVEGENPSEFKKRYLK
ncbi:AraC family transcriptional regulator [Dyadobacter frigoris]|uniref:Helix-turn-helix domain-containing protein n=1 Tax=Dyadobacter frigoris TaxID=2576211 RepID=A0A4U6DCA5_9BACT|nr:AraC family transcriptional regulator [Dyadobacter frigoris]TKT91994.1 helix-turn-helix domain-containing protein [Dyadobacter frigoris]GLU53130.1 AraC family transcriptional regulator [Dyadobacter frigoris]